MDPRQLSRLQEEQMKAISQTDVTIEQVKHFKQDYKSLQERLRTLPHKLTHDVMVPFGKLAFMPGRLTHTNEILVLLGDNWFVERSARQAIDIVDRRIKELDQKLTELKAQQKLLQPRLGFTSDLQAEIQGRGEVKEIVEEYDESEEKLWDEQHRKNIKKHKEDLRKHFELQNSQERKEDTQNSPDRREDRQKTDEYLWSRLDELERQEAKRGELRNLSGGEGNEDEDQGESQVGSNISRYTERRVSWADNVTKATEIESENDESGGEYTDDDDDDDDDDEDADSEADESGDDETGTPRTLAGRTITFTHSPTPFVLPHQVSEGNDLTIHSPADIYKLYSPKSILKKTVDSEDVSNVNKKKESSSLSTITSTSGTNKAFTGLVVEKISDPPAAAATTERPPSCATTATGASTEPPVKRVSKFKSSRQHETTS